jgi:hypothetical protein
LRLAARLGLKLETRTKEWFDLAMERELYEQINPNDAGEELQQLAREDKPATVLKAWETNHLLKAVSPLLAKKHPHYDALNRLVRSRDELLSAGLRPRLAIPTAAAILGRLKSRELSGVLQKAKFRAAEISAIQDLDDESKELVKTLVGKKTKVPRDAYALLEKTPLSFLAYILAESSNSTAKSKIRAYLQKWRPMRMNLPSVAAELESLGMARGPKFDKVVEDFFNAQLSGKGKTPEDRTRILRKLSGIKEAPKKEEKKKPVKPTPSKAVSKMEAMKAAKARAAEAAKGMPATKPGGGSSAKASAKPSAKAKKPAAGKKR